MPGENALNTEFAAFLDNFRASVLIDALQARQDVQSLTSPNLTLFNGQEAYIAVTNVQPYVASLQAVVASGVVGYNPQIGQALDGILFGVQATVSADRRYVTLTLQPTLFRNNGFTTFQVTGNQDVGGGVGGGGGGGGVGGDDGAGAGGGGGFFGIDGGDSPASFLQLPNQEVITVRTTVSVPDGGTLLLGGQTITGEVTRTSGVPILSKVPFLERLFTNTATAKDEQVLLILVRPKIIIQREVEQENFPLLSIAGD